MKIIDMHTHVFPQYVALAVEVMDRCGIEACVTLEWHDGPCLEQAADLILAPYDGYDPKGPLYKEALTFKGDELVGVHTYDDAMLYVAGKEIPQTRFSVVDVMPTVLSLMDVACPAELDGRSLI